MSKEYKVWCSCCGKVGSSTKTGRITQLFNVPDKVDKTSKNIVAITVFYGHDYADVARKTASAWDYTVKEFEGFCFDRIDYLV